MSEFGTILLIIAGLIIILCVIVFFSWLTTLIEEHGSLPRAIIHALRLIFATKDVKPYLVTSPLMSGEIDRSAVAFSEAEISVSLAETNDETAETPQRVGETHAESFTLGETAALARLVAAGKLGLTDAVRIGADAKSGEKYQKRSRDIKAAIDKLQNKYPNMTPEQQRAREALGLGKS